MPNVKIQEWIVNRSINCTICCIVLIFEWKLVRCVGSTVNLLNTVYSYWLFHLVVKTCMEVYGVELIQRSNQHVTHPATAW